MHACIIIIIIIIKCKIENPYIIYTHIEDIYSKDSKHTPNIDTYIHTHPDSWIEEEKKFKRRRIN